MLKKVYPNGLTYGEITQRLGKTRKLKANVSQALAQLCMDGKVVKDKKRYKCPALPYPLPEIWDRLVEQQPQKQ
jgi:hypothetical protein